MTRSTRSSAASTDRAPFSSLQMMATAGRRRDFESELLDVGAARHRNRHGKARTAGEMTVQASFNHHSNFSSQQSLVRLVGHREPK